MRHGWLGGEVQQRKGLSDLPSHHPHCWDRWHSSEIEIHHCVNTVFLFSWHQILFLLLSWYLDIDLGRAEYIYLLSSVISVFFLSSSLSIYSEISISHQVLGDVEISYIGFGDDSENNTRLNLINFSTIKIKRYSTSFFSLEIRLNFSQSSSLLLRWDSTWHLCVLRARYVYWCAKNKIQILVQLCRLTC